MEKKCQFCERIFFNQINLEEHVLNVHSKKKSISCKKCSKIFGRLDNLRRHEKRCYGDAEVFVCIKCSKSFSRKDDLKRHQKLCIDAQETFHCNLCSKLFDRKSHLTEHQSTCSVNEKQCIDGQKTFQCNHCLKSFHRRNNLTRHQSTCSVMQHPIQEPSGSGIKRKIQESTNRYDIETVNTAFKKAVITYQIKFEDGNTLDSAIHAMKEKLSTFRMNEHSLKFNMAVHVEFEKATDPEVITDPPVVLQSEQFEVYHETSIEEQLEKVVRQLNTNIDVYEHCGSGWVLKRLIALDTTLWKLDPLKASTYHELPKWIIDKHTVINVKNNDQYCFKWSVLAGLHESTTKTNQNLTSSYTAYENLYDYSGLKFPVSLNQIKVFENRNKISINVYGIEDDEENPYVYPLKVSQTENEKHVNLLLTEKNGIMHYSTIKNFSRLVGSQYTKDGHTHLYCYSCLHGFKLRKNETDRNDSRLLKQHRDYCKTLKPQRTIFPTEEESILKFTNVQKQLKAPFVMYADFEAMLIKTENHSSNTFIEKDDSAPKLKKKKENIYQEHKVISYAFKIVSIDPEFNESIEVYKGEDAVDKFLTSAQKKAKEIYEKYILKQKPKPELSVEEKKLHDETTHCHICKEEFTEEDTRVEDHCYI